MTTIHHQKLGRSSYILAVVLMALLGGCALTPSEDGEAKYHVASREEAIDLNCASNETPSCMERMGQPTKCFCSSRDDLERILEDPLYEEDTFRR